MFKKIKALFTKSKEQENTQNNEQNNESSNPVKRYDNKKLNKKNVKSTPNSPIQRFVASTPIDPISINKIIYKKSTPIVDPIMRQIYTQDLTANDYGSSDAFSSSNDNSGGCGGE